MKIKGMVFDIGQTLVYYPVPLNWSSLYRPAFEAIAKQHGLTITEDEYTHIGKTLARYNTRINPRETEVSSDVIFTEILNGTGIPMDAPPGNPGIRRRAGGAEKPEVDGDQDGHAVGRTLRHG